MSADLTLELENYFCKDCLRDRDIHVKSLVRMIPNSIVFNKCIVGDEYWCCPVCHLPKFQTKKPCRAVMIARPKGEDKKPKPKTKPRLVK